jgi:hypothetical protein
MPTLAPAERPLFRRVLRKMARLWLCAANRLDNGDRETASHYLRRHDALQRAWTNRDDVRVRQFLTRRWV